LTLSSIVKNQALVGESGNRKLPDGQGETGQSDHKRSYKKRIAVMSVSIPVMIMSLKGVRIAVWTGHEIWFTIATA
jgi:hypothetical protein